MDKDLSFLTEKQRTAYILRHQGKIFKEIGEYLNTSTDSARKYYARAERRIREYEQYNDIKEKNNMPLEINITYGELKLIIRALIELISYMDKNIKHNVKSDWMGSRPYEYTIIKKLLERIELIYNDIQEKN